MRLIIIGVLTGLIASTSAFAQQQKARPGGVCANGYERCVKGGIRMGYSSTEAAGFCTRRCAGR
jgi:hypothetical protein